MPACQINRPLIELVSTISPFVRTLGLHSTLNLMNKQLLLLAMLFGPMISAHNQTPGESQLFTKQELIEDTRTMMDYLENIHPDPYLYSGGRVALNRSFQNILQAIPAGGMQKDAYIRLLRPFIASLRDAHTRLATPYAYDPSSPGGIPLSFGSVEKLIYVDGVVLKEHSFLLGAVLLSVEGVPVRELLGRLARNEGIENEYHGLMRLQARLKVRPYLSELLPEWKDLSGITASFKLPDGRTRELRFALPVELPASCIRPESAIRLPKTVKTEFSWDFSGPDKKTVILKIDGLTAYREMFESIAEGRDIRKELEQIYEKIHGRKAPEDNAELLAGIPSAVETFKEMLAEMKKAGTRNLVVDLSRNTGGNSLMADILNYFLYGKEALAEIVTEAPPVKKYSSYYFNWKNEESIEQINREYSRIQSYPLTENDFDFSTERYIALLQAGRLDTLSGLRLKYRSCPGFIREIESGAYESSYHPHRVIVTSSHSTFSSAFTLLRYLNRSGAEVVGSTPGQSGNGFGNIIYMNLPHTGIRLAISHDAYLAFPGRASERVVIEPACRLSWEKLKEYGFDPNAEVRLALEILSQEGK